MIFPSELDRLGTPANRIHSSDLLKSNDLFDKIPTPDPSPRLMTARVVAPSVVK